MRLQDYLKAQRMTQAQFAAEIGVTAQSVYRYLHEGRVPVQGVLARIAQFTGGQVMPNDFHQFTVVAGSHGEPACER